ncbi:hypothetical protein [Pseudonocardia sp.]|uniref:hypothetical protein n=1 Tax=Pseudonocardia sp. TaxID=60912 RepID=UPI002D8150EC|nr:hypothetical protein [Pseudonocardia sp.]
MDASPAQPAPPSVTRANAARVVAFLAVLALTAAGGWQAGRILEPPRPAPVPATTHGQP